MLAARIKAILLLFLESGLRLVELAAQTVQAIDISGQRVVVRHGSMEKGRSAGFAVDTKKALWRCLALRATAWCEGARSRIVHNGTYATHSGIPPVRFESGCAWCSGYKSCWRTRTSSWRAWEPTWSVFRRGPCWKGCCREEKNTALLARLARGPLRQKRDALEAALNGVLRLHDRFSWWNFWPIRLPGRSRGAS